MRMDEAHILEKQLEQEMKNKHPNHPALKYYGSTWKAINGYTEVLWGYKLFEEAYGDQDV